MRQGGFLIAKIHQAAGRIFARKLKAHGLKEINPAQGRILFALWQEAPLTITQLAKRTSLGKSTLTTMLDRLEEAGLLRRTPSPTDRRETLIERTLADERFRAAFLAVSAEMTALFYQGFTEAEIERFEADLARILTTLEGTR
jgi:MarR family transcriptional regulator, organic hydroperoxide resistance regulator